jgi:two-component system cell cycle response regulator
MSGRVLVVDDVAADLLSLKVKLCTACYEVMPAEDAAEGLRLARADAPCLVVISAELGSCDAPAPEGVPAPPMGAPLLPAWAPQPETGPHAVPAPQAPGMNAVALCRRLRGHPSTATVPIIAVTSRDATERRLALLEAGADEVLLKPFDERFFHARIRSLLRARDEMNELRLRESTSRVLGFAEGPVELAAPGRAVLVAPEEAASGRLRRALERHLSDRLTVMAPAEILAGAETDSAPDVFVVDASDPATAQHTLSILPELRARSESRHAAIIVLTAPGEEATSVLALDLGANDVAPAPGDPAELALRVRKQIRWKQGRDRLRQTVRDGLHAAITDPLTGLYNRRYAIPHLERVVDAARETGRRFAVLLADLDHFKAVNDTHGHAAGDAVLVETARRMRENLRSMDMVARIGGEEFLVAMPDTGLEEARIVAERLCGIMREQPIVLPDGLSITVTMSMGLAMGSADGPVDPFGGGALAATQLMEAADQALYGAKTGGRAQYRISRDAA